MLAARKSGKFNTGGFKKGYTSWNSGTAKQHENVCGYCGVYFYTIYKKQKYCSLECSHAETKGKRNEKSKICITCGSEFFVDAHDFDERKYCKISCRPSWNKGLTKETNEYLKLKSVKMHQQYVAGELDITKLLAARNITPNKQEISFNNLLQALIPNSWKYVGDGAVWMTSKHKHLNPDFIHRSANKVIEYCGNYWHTLEEAEERKILYDNIGWKCLIIWEKDFLKNNNLVKKMVLDFSLS